MYSQIDSNKQKTWFLIFFFLVFIIGLGWVFSYAFDNSSILYFAVGWSVFQALISYFYSDKITLAISGAKELKRNESEKALEIHRLVENLSITAGLPKPKIYLIDDSAPNAFATGRDPKNASMALTTGIIDKLNKSELEGVISHELSHIGNYDIRVMTIVVVLVGIVALVSDWFLRWSFWNRRSDDREGGQFQAIIMVIAIVLAILSPIIATLIQLAVSRKREYLADATGAMLTRYPAGLISALEKISHDREPLEVANKATAHLYIVSPFKNKQEIVGWFSNLFNTHPAIKDRIKTLEKME
ncbi:MAG: Protease HtpX [Candidatus Berkelbacteria bacterium Licking1014_85]|uniref:Protease HtpX homolog n=1 Tax=Candidatus Berkelbacteria bacterium Licking1014_85 TaxID=2017148 RepID=A0A554LH89_9BACT|nr:MAG: Protease HtpX [Candidatus Berkelbacteria bacterium Licking1014_85]